MMKKARVLAAILALVAVQAAAQAPPASIDRTRSGTGPWTGKHNNIPRQTLSPVGTVFTPPSSFGNFWILNNAASQTIACPADIADGDNMAIHIQQGSSAPFSPTILFNPICYGWAGHTQPTWSASPNLVDWAFCQSMNPPDVTGASVICSPQINAGQPPAWAFVNATSCGSSAPATPCTTPSVSMTGANLLVVSVGYSSSGGASLAPATDSAGDTYTLGVSGTGGTSAVLKCYYYQTATPISGSLTFSATTSNGSANSYSAIAAAGFSGAIASPLDQTSTASVANGTSVGAGSQTPTHPNELIVACLDLNQSTTTSGTAINGGFTIPANGSVNGGANNDGGAIAYLIQTTATTTNPTWSWTNSSDGVGASMGFRSQ